MRQDFELTKQARDLDLVLLLPALGASRDPLDQKRWRTSRGAISVTGQKFFNWNCGSGGGGAIDLAMHLLPAEFRSARDWLVNNFLGGQQKPPPSLPAFIPPPSSDDYLPEVLDYLTNTRRLPRPLLLDLLDEGRIYADRRANAVFMLLGKNRITIGAELRGTGAIPWKGMAKGSSRTTGFFFSGDTTARDCFLCESAIDALSLQALSPGALYLSTAGVAPNPKWLPILLQRGYRVHCAFDRDEPGELAARKMMMLWPTIQRIRPNHKDWNEDLLAR